MIIGIDIGSTITKAVAIENGAVIKQVKTKAMDAVTSAAGAFGKMLVENGIKISDIEKIKITGAGASRIVRTESEGLFGVDTRRVDEIIAIGIGGMFQSGKDNIIIANVGTGTAVIEARKDTITHLGGSGVGGGTILGLAKKMLSTSNFSGILEMAETGNLNQVDLSLDDIMDTDISFLNKDSTASNFGKMNDNVKSEDIALGILNMVYQTIGMLSVFAARSRSLNDVIVTGSGSNNPVGKRILMGIAKMYGVTFGFPENAEYVTAIGAGLSY